MAIIDTINIIENKKIKYAGIKIHPLRFLSSCSLLLLYNILEGLIENVYIDYNKCENIPHISHVDNRSIFCERVNIRNYMSRNCIPLKFTLHGVHDLSKCMTSHTL